MVFPFSFFAHDSRIRKFEIRYKDIMKLNSLIADVNMLLYPNIVFEKQKVLIGLLFSHECLILYYVEGPW